MTNVTAITKAQALQAMEITNKLTETINGMGGILDKATASITAISEAVQADDLTALEKAINSTDDLTLSVAGDVTVSQMIKDVKGKSYKELQEQSDKFATALVFASMHKEKVRTTYESCSMIYGQIKKMDKAKEKGIDFKINGITIKNDTTLATACGLSQGSISRIRTFFKHIDKKPKLVDKDYEFLKDKNLEYLYGVGLMWDVDNKFKPTGEETAEYLKEKARKLKNKTGNKPDGKTPDDKTPDGKTPDGKTSDGNTPISTNSKTPEQFKHEFNSAEGIKLVMGSLVIDWVNTLEKGDSIQKELSALYSEILGKIRERLNKQEPKQEPKEEPKEEPKAE